jgi:uncharacterized protein
MLIRFVVSNFLSFNEETEFNMLTGNFKIHKSHILTSKNIELLKSAAIYGANGSGKSNLIKAVDFLKNIVINKRESQKKISLNCFKLDNSCYQKPTTFGIEFIKKNKAFLYHLSILENIIVEESLYQKNKKFEDELIFDRKVIKGKIKIKLNDKYLSDDKDKLLIELYEEDLLKDNQTFISQVNGKKFKEINLAYEWFDENLIVIFPMSKYTSMFSNLIDDNKFKDFITEMIKNADTGITELTSKDVPFDTYFGDDDKEIKENVLKDLESDSNSAIILQNEDSEAYITKSPKGEIIVSKLITKHTNKHGELIDFEIMEESDGSRRLLDIVPSIDIANEADVTFFIDEINRSMHPSLTKELISLFLSKESSKGQIIFTTHESNLLDLKMFRQDEIWFTEKKHDGSTTMYPLSDFKPRYDLDIKKGYLLGRFGAIPFLGNLKDLNW